MNFATLESKVFNKFSSVQFNRSVVSHFLRPHGLQQARALCPSTAPGIYSNSCPQSQWWHPTISSCLPLCLPPSIFPNIRVFSNESVLHIRWPEYWSFSFNISHSNEYSGLISFRMDWLNLLAVQETLKSLLQHYSSKASILENSALCSWSALCLAGPRQPGRVRGASGKKKKKKKHQFFRAQLSLYPSSDNHTWPLEKP